MTEQEKRKMVIRGLECCSAEDKRAAFCHEYDCPYRDYEECPMNLMRDALDLLKAQEPKLITREEWDEWRHRPEGKRDPLFLQLDRTSGVWILKPEAWHEIAFLTGEIKVWNKKPTVEQMMAVKWND